MVRFMFLEFVRVVLIEEEEGLEWRGWGCGGGRFGLRF